MTGGPTNPAPDAPAYVILYVFMAILVCAVIAFGLMAL